MFILNKDCNDVYNTDHIVNIYQDECTIKVCAGTATRGGVLGTTTMTIHSLHIAC